MPFVYPVKALIKEAQAAGLTAKVNADCDASVEDPSILLSNGVSIQIDAFSGYPVLLSYTQEKPEWSITWGPSWVGKKTPTPKQAIEAAVVFGLKMREKLARQAKTNPRRNPSVSRLHGLDTLRQTQRFAKLLRRVGKWSPAMEWPGIVMWHHSDPRGGAIYATPDYQRDGLVVVDYEVRAGNGMPKTVASFNLPLGPMRQRAAMYQRTMATILKQIPSKKRRV